ncbi:hypothetical protein VAE308_170001 [Vibrio aestuarianus]|uniref:Uncharacterized protein n=1 Tax=Vibrio aestuarianus TaxID=28171 RepID=A0ABM9FUP6_9VIBR|nr:hypothetical protein VAE142_370003 [Vibrio aestuarianus]CAH8231679.1 hypothetical protein VAE308_170001 [Vibrio aestuarianus]CAH8242057.1 hypothetical protein VAE063_90003 [Vibrio aestuarianus]
MASKFVIIESPMIDFYIVMVQFVYNNFVKSTFLSQKLTV